MTDLKPADAFAARQVFFTGQPANVCQEILAVSFLTRGFRALGYHVSTYQQIKKAGSAMSVAIELKAPGGHWIQLVDGVKENGELVEDWMTLAKELYPASEVRVVEAADPAATARH